MTEIKEKNTGFIFAKTFSEAISTNNCWQSNITEKIKTSSKSVYEQTYNRYEENHTDYMKFTLVDKVLGSILDEIEIIKIKVQMFFHKSKK